MKFRVAISILTIVIIGLFVTSVFLTFKVLDSKKDIEDINKSLNSTNKKLKESEINLEKSKDSLILVMKALDVWESKAQERRKEEVKKENRAKYDLLFTVRANNANYRSIVAYFNKSGFNVKMAKQVRDIEKVQNAPVIFYYSDDSETIAVAKELQADLIKNFDSKLYQTNFKIQRGASENYSKNTFIAELILQ